MNSPMDIEQLRERRKNLGQQIHQCTLELNKLRLRYDARELTKKQYYELRVASLAKQEAINDTLRAVKSQLADVDPAFVPPNKKPTAGKISNLMLRWLYDLEDFSRAMHTIISEKHCEECALELWRCPICNSAQAMTNLFNRKPAEPGPAPF